MDDLKLFEVTVKETWHESRTITKKYCIFAQNKGHAIMDAQRCLNRKMHGIPGQPWVAEALDAEEVEPQHNRLLSGGMT